MAETPEVGSTGAGAGLLVASSAPFCSAAADVSAGVAGRTTEVGSLSDVVGVLSAFAIVALLSACVSKAASVFPSVLRATFALYSSKPINPKNKIPNTKSPDLTHVLNRTDDVFVRLCRERRGGKWFISRFTLPPPLPF
ncbi:hypothetical protein EN829_046665 [Mesorhizobium sp. M00.F.Ca.ET.186.01.1.1]|nr:hypothetical protein EN829_046665 [Mesorhizobium sp. M00.F.Ca.ET.186.01.1.1]